MNRNNLSNFEWQIEENATPDVVLPAAKEPAKQRRLPAPVAAFTVLFVIVVASYLLQQRVLERETAVVETLVANHQLLLSAIERKDEELFQLALAGYDPAWLEGQMSLLADGLHFDRRALALVPAGVGSNVSDVYLAPDLTWAEVVSRRNYFFDDSGGKEVTALEFTAVYQLEQDRWLLAPAGNRFWGEWLTIHGERLALTYRERDAAVAVRLAPELDAQLNETCLRLLDLNCPTGRFLWIHLDDDPHSLHLLADARLVLQQGGRKISLPAPSLLGVPADEVAYRALVRWYAIQVVSATIADLVEWRCCDRFLFFQALLDKQLSQLGLRPWPVSSSHYRQILDISRLTLTGTSYYWYWTLSPDFQGRWPLYAFVDFALDSAPELSVAERQRQLSRSATYTGWVQQALNRPEPLSELDQAWLHFAELQLGLVDTAIEINPEPAPANQLVYLVDFAGHDWSTNVFAIDPRTAEVVFTLETHYLPDVALSPDGRLLYVADTYFGRDPADALHVYDALTGERLQAGAPIPERLLYMAPHPAHANLMVTPDGRHILVRKYGEAGTPHLRVMALDSTTFLPLYQVELWPCERIVRATAGEWLCANERSLFTLNPQTGQRSADLLPFTPWAIDGWAFTADGSELFLLTHGRQLDSGSYSPTTMAGTIIRFDAQTYELVGHQQLQGTEVEGSDPFRPFDRLAVSPDGSRLYLGATDSDFSVKEILVYDTLHGSLHSTFVLPDPVWHFTLNPAGDVLMAVSYTESSLVFFDSETFRQTAVLHDLGHSPALLIVPAGQ